MLLDTTFLIDLERELEMNRVGPARRFLGQRRSDPVAVSVIARRTRREHAGQPERARIRFSFSCSSLEAGSRARILIRAGNRLGENDTWLAGTARYYGIPIVSNDRAFDRVPALRRVAY